MALTTRPDMTDDTGTFDNGTAVNEAFIDDIFDQIEDQTHSTTNPAIKPKAITDEVVAARGNLASLDARISAVVDDDGAPVPAAGQATETQLARAEGNINLVSNGDLEDWAAGASAAPDHFTLSGSGAAVARTGTGEADTQDLGVGTYAAKITSGGGAAAKLTQILIASADYSKYRSVDGRKVGFTLRAKVANSNVLRIVVDDGATTTVGSYVSGSADEQDVSVVHTISASATKLDVYAEVALGTNTAYVGGFTAVFSDLAPAAWNPLWAKFRQDILDEAQPDTGFVNGGTLVTRFRGVVDQQTNDAASSGTGETDAHSYTLPAGVLANDGDKLIIRARGTMTGNTNNKTFKVYFGGVAYTVLAVASNVTNFRIEVEVTRTGASAQVLSGIVFAFNDGVITGFTGGGPAYATPAIDMSGTIAIKTTLQHATAGTITEKFFEVEVVPGEAA